MSESQKATRGHLTFSVIMPSYLGRYKGAARHRDKKIVRAINSVINQTYPYWELIVVADGCQQTVDIVRKFTDSRIRGFLIPKQAIWDGSQRNTGISKARGEYIIYLDIDDMYDPDYLKGLSEEMDDRLDWYWMDDIIWDKNIGKLRRQDNALELTRCGTSSIMHRRDLDIYWGRNSTYLHDWVMIQRLMQNPNHRKLKTAGYCIMHMPYMYDV